MRRRIVLLAMTLGFVTDICAVTARAQPPVTGSTDQPDQTLEFASCRTLSPLLQSEDAEFPRMRDRWFHMALGWWGRGFLEAAAGSADVAAAHSTIPESQPTSAHLRALNEFGASAEQIATRLVAYCREHPDKTPFDGVRMQLQQVLKLAQ